MWEATRAGSAAMWDRKREEEAAKKAYYEGVIKSKKDFNDQAQVGFLDVLAPWDTGNERADKLNRELMTLQSGDAQMANDYYDSEGMTGGARWADENFKWTPTTNAEQTQTINDAKQSLGNIGQGMQDLKSKYFGGGEPVQSVQQTQPAPLTTQQTELGNNLPSSLKQPDNISSFWDYLKNKQ